MKSNPKHKGQVPTVSVKSTKSSSAKRKGETAGEIYDEEIGNREAKKLKKGMSKKKGGKD